jgi:hypothetical protein
LIFILIVFVFLIVFIAIAIVIDPPPDRFWSLVAGRLRPRQPM